jgi:hypothetical protein
LTRPCSSPRGEGRAEGGGGGDAAVPAEWPVTVACGRGGGGGGGGRRGGQREAATSIGVVEGRKGNDTYILGFGLEGGRCESLICRSTSSNSWRDHGQNSAHAGCGAGPLRQCPNNSLPRATWTCSQHRSLFAESVTLGREFFS